MDEHTERSRVCQLAEDLRHYAEAIEPDRRLRLIAWLLAASQDVKRGLDGLPPQSLLDLPDAVWQEIVTEAERGLRETANGG